MSNGIFSAIDKAVKVEPNPAVYISGGIDSCIVLHHLRQKFKGEIHTFTAMFGNEGDKEETVERIAYYYDTKQHFVIMENFVEVLYEVMTLPFKEPRYNIWPFWLARKAEALGCENIYIGEGSDEIFGGYADRDFLTGWAGQIIYVRPTFDIIHDYWKLKLHAPFSDLDWFEFYHSSYFPPQKIILRETYKGIIPNFVIDIPAQPPAFTNYFDTWRKELKDYVEFEDDANISIQQIKDALQLLATDAWCKARKMKLKRKQDMEVLRGGFLESYIV